MISPSTNAPPQQRSAGGDGEMDIQIEAFALVLSKGYSPKQITKINLAEDGSLAGVELGTDADGFGIFILNFAL
jgi:hypothetical protein